jgi:type III secretion protein L
MPFHTAIHVNQLELSIRGKIIRADEWRRAEQGQDLLQATQKIKANAEQAALLMREHAREAGYQAGQTKAAAELAGQLAQIERERVRFLAQNEQRIMQIALAVVDRLLPSLPVEHLLPNLVREAVAAAFAEQFLSIRVHPSALEATQAELQTFRSMHPAVANVEISADKQLDPLSCVVSSDVGEVRGDLTAQLAGIREALLQASRPALAEA